MQSIKFDNLYNGGYVKEEAFKSLRTNLKFCGQDKKVIVLTSSIPREGKSSTVFGLAKSLAEDNKKTILVDCDLRKSVLIGRYKVQGAKKGLTHYLSGQSDLDEVMYKTNIDNLDIIFSGHSTPRPSELLDEQLFKDLINKLRQEYDYVLIDTPPIGSVIDAAVVSKICDGIVIVIESNKISYKFVQNVKEQLDKTGCEILGVVLNKVDLSNDKYYEKYYGKY